MSCRRRRRSTPTSVSTSTLLTSTRKATTTPLSQQRQLMADALLAQSLSIQEFKEQRSLIPSTPNSSSSSSSFPSVPPPGWASSHPDDPSNNPALRAELIAQHHQHLNSAAPFPDVHALFLLYSQLFFFNQLCAVHVRWSKRMTSCAGLCRFQGSGGCDIALSEALLKFRSKKEVVETLLHEMIHAYLFVGQPPPALTRHPPLQCRAQDAVRAMTAHPLLCWCCAL